MAHSMSMSIKNRNFPALDRRAVIALGALTVAALAWAVGLRGTPNGKAASAPQAAASVQQQPDHLLVKLRASGFEQAEVSHAAGQFVLVVELGKDFRNEEVTLQLTREGGSQVAEINVPAGIPVRSQEVNLQAGTYSLVVSGHSGWVCRINVQ